MNRTVAPFDFNNVFSKATVGFDRLFDEATLLANSTYPPHNIIQTSESTFEIELAVAGFDQDELKIVVENNSLKVTGSKSQKDHIDYLHRGIAFRDFERVFKLGQYIEVESAEHKNGLLLIKLVRNVPDAMKPKTIPIASREVREFVEGSTDD